MFDKFVQWIVLNYRIKTSNILMGNSLSNLALNFYLKKVLITIEFINSYRLVISEGNGSCSGTEILVI